MDEDRAKSSGSPARFKLDLTVSVVALTVASLPVFMVGALAVQIRESLRFGTTVLGGVISVYYLGSVLSAVPLGKLTESVGALRVMRLACGMCGVILAAIAALAWTTITLGVMMLLAGTASVAVQVATNQFLTHRIEHGKRGLAFGIKQASVPISAVLAGVAVPTVAINIGWRWAFAFAAAIAFLAYWFFPHPSDSVAGYRAKRPAGRITRAEISPLAVLAIGSGLGIATGTALSGFLVASTVALGISKGAAGILVAFGGLVAAFSRILVGAQVDHHRDGDRLFLVAAMMLLGSAGFFLLSVTASTRLTFLLILGVIVAFGAGWGWNGLFNLAVISQHPDHPARATGITQIGNRLGGVVGPILFGFTASHSSYASAWLGSGITALVAAGTIILGLLLLRSRAE